VRELDSVSKQLTLAKCNHETESVKRLEYESRIKIMRNEQSVQEQVHRKVQTAACFPNFCFFLCIIVMAIAATVYDAVSVHYHMQEFG